MEVFGDYVLELLTLSQQLLNLSQLYCEKLYGSTRPTNKLLRAEMDRAQRTIDRIKEDFAAHVAQIAVNLAEQEKKAE
jgi:hypothetical protein